MSAGKKIIEGLEEALRHIRCSKRHVESHVTTKSADCKWKTTCMKCGHSWTEETRDDGGLQVIRPSPE
jgi:peptide subunit release factor 1 (eRF1)